MKQGLLIASIYAATTCQAAAQQQCHASYEGKASLTKPPSTPCCWTEGAWGDWLREQHMHDHDELDDLNDLYRRTKMAQVQAEQFGFDGTAAVLADVALTLADQPGMDLALVRRLEHQVTQELTIH